MARRLVTLALLLAAAAAKDEHAAEAAANDITVKVERRFLVDTKERNAAEAVAEQPADKGDEHHEKEEEGQGTQPEHRQRYVVPKAAFKNPNDRNDAPDDGDVFVRHDVVELPLLNKSLEFDVYESWMPGPLLPSWAVAVLMSVFGLLMLMACCLAAGNCHQAADLGEEDVLPWPSNPIYIGYVPCSPEYEDCVELNAFFRREAALIVLTPWLAALLLSVARLVAGGLAAPLPPLLSATLVLRACVIDWRFLSGEMRIAEVRDFLISKLEIADAISDGLATAVALTVDVTTRSRWAASFQAPAVICHVLAAMGPGFALAVALAFSSILQWAAVAGSQLPSAYASLAGLGVAANALDRDYDKTHRTMIFMVVRSTGEAAPQLLLQTALLAATGEGLAEQPVVACSVVLSCAMLIKSAVEMALELAKTAVKVFYPEEGVIAEPGAVPWIILIFACAALMNMLLAAMAALAALRLVGVEACASRTWTLAGGCLPPSALVV